MNAWLGAGLGLAFATGVLLLAHAVVVRRRVTTDARVLPYLHDLRPLRPRASGLQTRSGWDRVTAALARGIDQVLGGRDSITRRLARARRDETVHDFRVEQAIWGVAGFAVAAVPAGLVSLASPSRAVPLMVLSLASGCCAVLLCENRLSAQVRRREQQVLAQFPVVAELLALAVAAGESPVAALSRVADRSQGALSQDLRDVLAQVRTGTPLAQALDEFGARSGLPVVTRFAEAMAVAIERGTPLSDVLHAQAADVREASRRQLIETGARKEVAMMVPVVFIVLPVVIVFAFFPGLIGLKLVV